MGSLRELETHLLLSQRVGLSTEDRIHPLLDTATIPSSPLPDPQPGAPLPLASSSPFATRHSPLTSALLAIRLCDPACGSGHFLIAAAHRIAGKLSQARAGGDEPSPAESRAALRDVIRHCIYGVDLNPMAVELCKVNLWLESLGTGQAALPRRPHQGRQQPGGVGAGERPQCARGAR